MGMTIDDPEVQAMACRLAERQGTSVTDALRQALRAELERTGSPPTAPTSSARRAALLELLERYRSLHWPDQRSSRELQDELYDEHGLPA